MEYYLQVKNGNIISCSNLPVIDEDIENVEVSKSIYVQYKENPKKFYFEDGEIKTKTEEQQKEEILQEQFFPTTLGYVRRSVTMKDGSKKSFLTDILPLLVVGVPVLVYSRELEQTRVQATEAFINECKQQLFVDFYGGE